MDPEREFVYRTPGQYFAIKSPRLCGDMAQYTLEELKTLQREIQEELALKVLRLESMSLWPRL